jgi:CubicO group peptidase (beta-lactamase class C family)
MTTPLHLKHRLALAGAILLVASARAAAPATDAELLSMMKTRVDVDHAGTGMVVGLIDAGGSHVLAYGNLSDGGAPVDADTVYEIGSITKVFTATILSDMALRGEVGLADPVARYVPADAAPPAFGGRQITLADLSSQVSGIPGIPTNLAPKDEGNPFADYTVPQLYAFVHGYTPTRAAGERYEYSNAGIGLLGHVLALRAGADYETLVRQRITGKLGMDSTAIALTPAMRRHLATGYGMPGMAAPNWDMPVLAGMGALRSSTADMLKFVGANMGLPKSPLYGAMQATHQPRHAVEGKPELSVGLGWHVLEQHGAHIVWHNGGTAGYRTYIGFDTSTGRGVVLMSNSHMGSDDIARRALNSAFPLIVPKPMAM